MKPLRAFVRENRITVPPEEMQELVYHHSIPALDLGGPELVESTTIDSHKTLLSGGELLVSRLNPRKPRVHLVNRDLDHESVASTEFVPLQVIAGDPRFLRYLMLSEGVRQDLDSKVRSATRSHQRVDPAEIMATPVPLVDVDEQRRIADFLDDRVARIDQIIAARRRQASLADAALLETARTLTTRGRSSATRPSGIAWMPEIGAQHALWRIGQAFTTGSGTTPRSDKVDYYDGEIPWATTSDLRDSLAVLPPRTVTSMALADHSALALYPAGTLLVAMYGATVGRAGILAVGATVNQACCALQSREIISPKYAFYWLLAHRSEIMTLASGGGQPNISQDVVRGLRIPAPPWDEQFELAAALDESAEQADLARASLTGSVELLDEYKQSLITAAVTGEIDVTTAGSGIPG